MIYRRPPQAKNRRERQDLGHISTGSCSQVLNQLCLERDEFALPKFTLEDSKILSHLLYLGLVCFFITFLKIRLLPVALLCL